MRWLSVLKFAGIGYLFFTIYTLSVIIYRDYFKEENNKGVRKQIQHGASTKTAQKLTNPPPKDFLNQNVEIWGKAAIGLYLWQHIFEGPLEEINGNFLKEGELQLEGINFRFRTGPQITPQTIDQATENVILVINGREPKKVKFAEKWLQALKNFEKLKNLAVILLGNEKCQNEWLMQYMLVKGGFIKLAFIVYDVPYVDNANFFQWPLGVATYRDFPIIHSSNLLRMKKRKYICNFIGTVYEDSSRTKLMRTINSHDNLKNDCLIHTRNNWMPSETKETSELFQNAMRDSDLTLCPVGKNTECYRIYEAMSFGSIPVVEDVMTPGSCGRSSLDSKNDIPLRVLKKMGAPIIYIKSWEELPVIIDAEKRLPLEHIVKRRTDLLIWYQKFKYKLRNQYVGQIKHAFNFE